MTHEQILLDALKGGGWKSHHELYKLGVMVHSRVASLTAKGYRFEREQRGRTHFYRLKSRPLNEEGTAEAQPEPSSLSRRARSSDGAAEHADPAPSSGDSQTRQRPPREGTEALETQRGGRGHRVTQAALPRQLTIDLRQEAAC